MRIAFVGKGGSGKTTSAALFSKFLAEQKQGNILSIDADINVHLPELLTGYEFNENSFLSHPESSKSIKNFLIGNNKGLNLKNFKKTTPPTNKSSLICLDDFNNPILDEFSVNSGGINVMAVGTYSQDSIGTSCYHNNLAILENILTHTIDKNATIIVDMVAGTDAFASSLHAQFDLIIFVVEPTRRGTGVLRDYERLAKSAGVDNSLFVMGNKVHSEEDKNFLKDNISKDKLLGFLYSSDYLNERDKKGGLIQFDKLEVENKEVFKTIFEKLSNNLQDPNKRLKRIHELHKKYVAQLSITERFGDLTGQIDEKFKF